MLKAWSAVLRGSRTLKMWGLVEGGVPGGTAFRRD
jgi:hypothetical protein